MNYVREAKVHPFKNRLKGRDSVGGGGGGGGGKTDQIAVLGENVIPADFDTSNLMSLGTVQ